MCSPDVDSDLENGNGGTASKPDSLPICLLSRDKPNSIASIRILFLATFWLQTPCLITCVFFVGGIRNSRGDTPFKLEKKSLRKALREFVVCMRLNALDIVNEFLANH